MGCLTGQAAGQRRQNQPGVCKRTGEIRAESWSWDAPSQGPPSITGFPGAPAGTSGSHNHPDPMSAPNCCARAAARGAFSLWVESLWQETAREGAQGPCARAPACAHAWTHGCSRVPGSTPTPTAHPQALGHQRLGCVCVCE